MSGTVGKSETAVVGEEARLAHAAATGDGSAFAALFERYEQGAFNFAYRILGIEADAAGAVQQGFLGAMRRLPEAGDAEPAFRPIVFTATHDACYELLQQRRGTSPSEAVSGEEVGEAAMRLPEHQREALALRELAEIPYEEIATIMDVNHSSVAQLISRARINLHDELRGNVLASVAAPSPECERALPLIAARDDGQLDPASPDAAWLDVHLGDCSRCRLGVEVMQEAAASYRTWAPIAAPPGLLKETMAKAAELAGDDWSEGRPSRRGRAAIAAGLAGLLLLVGGATAMIAGDDPAATSVDASPDSEADRTAAADEGRARPAKAGKAKGSADKRNTESRARSAIDETGATEAAVERTASAPGSIPVQATGGGSSTTKPPRQDGSSGKTAVQPTQPTSTSKPSTRPKPAPAPAPVPAPQPAPAPVVQEPPPVEESPGKSGHAEPPGKPADRPPK
jgi:DNA-directed RNA polymerase specialized sigma24 family protein